MDVVYFLGKTVTNEFKYSLRTLRNLPNVGRVVVMAPALPPWITNVEHIETHEKSKWDALDTKFWDMCRNNDLTENVHLFEDDQHVIYRVRWLPAVWNNTLEAACKLTPTKETAYGTTLHATKEFLDEHVEGALSYETHRPFEVNRAEGRRIEKLLPERVSWLRPHTIYGNLAQGIERIPGPNVKVITRENLVRLVNHNVPILSSLDSSFETTGYRQTLDGLGFNEKGIYEK